MLNIRSPGGDINSGSVRMSSYRPHLIVPSVAWQLPPTSFAPLSKLYFIAVPTLHPNAFESHATFMGWAGHDWSHFTILALSLNATDGVYFPLCGGGWGFFFYFLTIKHVVISKTMTSFSIVLVFFVLISPFFFDEPILQNKTLPIEDTTDCLSTMACVCRVMLETPWVLIPCPSLQRSEA